MAKTTRSRSRRSSQGSSKKLSNTVMSILQRNQRKRSVNRSSKANNAKGRKNKAPKKKRTQKKKSHGCNGSLSSSLNQMGGFVRDGSVQLFHKLTGK